jgi:AAA+ superfamily predicted ATPase
MKRTELQAALDASPENIPLLALYANVCEQELELDEMRSAWEQILALDPSHAEATCGVVRSLYLQGKISEATVRLETWLRTKTDYAPAFVLAARIAMSEQDSTQAQNLYRKALSIDGNSRDTGLEAELFPNGYTEDMSDPDGDPEFKMTEFGPWDDADPFFFDDDEPEKPLEFERPNTSFADVGGMEALKEEIRMKVLYPLENPQLFKAYGKKIGGGVLLYGPPGCGKTLISRATAGEIKANFISVALHEVLDMFIGNSEKQLHGLFEMARAHKPAVLFFDEVDALAADRRDLRQSAGRTLINQLLAEMDSSNDANEGLLILGATNSPWHIDPAFRRPGRFDRIIFAPPPDEEARAAIIEILAKDKPIEKFDATAIAKVTRDFSGADLKSLFDTAIEEALTEAMKNGRVIPITGKQLIKAAKKVKPTTKDWFASARNYAMYANQSGFYDDVLSYLGIKA